MSFQKELDRIRESAEQILTAVEKISNADVLNKPIAELGLSTRALNCLKWRDINYIGELLELSDRDLMRIRNMGKHTFNEITERVKEFMK